MRLSNQTQTIIRDTVHEIFGQEATVIVFGARIDDTAKGGDIDLLVQSESSVQRREHKIAKSGIRYNVTGISKHRYRERRKSP
jgi:hypothetical protein